LVGLQTIIDRPTIIYFLTIQRETTTLHTP